MDQFSYLSVLLSIVLGLGIANLLTGFARVIQMRTRVKLYWPVLTWAFTLVLIHIQTWWMMFGMQERREWSFAAFMLVLIQPILLFFLSALVWPDFDRDEALDLRANYFAQARWFFGMFIAIVVLSLVRTRVLTGQWTGPTDLAFHALFIAASAGAMSFSSELYHRINAAAAAVLFIAYVGLLFTELQ